MDSPQPQPDTTPAPDAASPVNRRPLPGSLGVAIVLVCLIVPLILGVWSVNAEQTSGEKAAQAVIATATATSANAPAATAQPGAQARPLLLDQHYYFVNGCVSASVDCGKAGAGNWGEYYQELSKLYGEAAASVAGKEQVPTFDEWAKTHVHFLSARTAADGAYEIEQALPQNTAQSDFHMIGTSAGGASIFAYLSRALRGEVPLDKRIRSAIAVDSPLGFQFPFRSTDLFTGIQAGAMKSDVELKIGEWAKAANISLFAVNTPNDIVNHETVPDVPEDAAPVYPAESVPPTPESNPMARLTQGSAWHVYTGSHMAESTQKFMEDHWR